MFHYSVHVRRTDKLREEAQRYDLDEYMERVNHWFRLQEKTKGRIDKRRVYLATDDPTVITNAPFRFVAAKLLKNISFHWSSCKDFPSKPQARIVAAQFKGHNILLYMMFFGKKHFRFGQRFLRSLSGISSGSS